MDSGWAALIFTIVVQVIAVAFLSGRFSARIESLEKWRDDDVKPELEDHGRRITALEVKR